MLFSGMFAVEFAGSRPARARRKKIAATKARTTTAPVPTQYHADFRDAAAF